MRKVYIFLLLFIITCAGAWFRFYHLGKIPVGFHQDEAFLAYNGYAILLTGKDITNNFLPLHLNSFFYSPAGYSYLSIPWIALFGLSTFSARFASAFWGTLTVPITFFFVSELYREKKHKEQLAVLSATLLAISPWHINLSRTATENIPVVFFTTLGVYLFTLSTRKKNMVLFIISFLLFFLTFFIYQAPRSFLPLFVPFLLIYGYRYSHTFFSKRIIFFSFLLYFLLTLVPLALILYSPTLSTRMKELSVFNVPQTQLLLDESLREDGVGQSSLFQSRLFHNKLTSYTTIIIQNYFDHLSYNFLFTDQGLPERYQVPDMGLLYLFELPLLLIALVYIVRSADKVGVFLIVWVLLAPVGSALTSDAVPNLQRTVIVFPALSILSAVGLQKTISLAKKKSIIIVPLISLIVIYSVFYYLHQYFVNQPLHRPWYRYEGSEQMTYYLRDRLSSGLYQKAIIANPDIFPPINLLFFLKYDPKKFQIQNNDNPSINDITFGPYKFISGLCPAVNQAAVLYVAKTACFTGQKHVTILKDIHRLDGSDAFSVAILK